MKTKLILLLLAFGLMSSTCSTEEQPTTSNDCNCEVVHYQRQITGWAGATPVYTFVEVGREEATQMNCDSQTDDYVLGQNGDWYRIYCN